MNPKCFFIRKQPILPNSSHGCWIYFYMDTLRGYINPSLCSPKCSYGLNMGSEALIGNPPKRTTMNSKSLLLCSYTHLMEKASEVNSKEKSWIRMPKVVCVCSFVYQHLPFQCIFTGTQRGVEGTYRKGNNLFSISICLGLVY